MILKQIQSIMVYEFRFKKLAYTIKWDDAAFASKFYGKKNAIIPMDRPELLKNMINIAVKIDDRQYEKFVDKKNMVQTHPKKQTTI